MRGTVRNVDLVTQPSLGFEFLEGIILAILNSKCKHERTAWVLTTKIDIQKEANRVLIKIRRITPPSHSS